jgi:uncharacterized membrane protein
MLPSGSSTLPGTDGVPRQRTGARRVPPRPRAAPAGPRSLRGRRIAALGPWALAAVFAVVYALDSVGRYAQGATMSWDLGLFTEAVKQYAHLHAPIVDARAPGFDLLGEHFHPILALLGPLFALAPTPVTLLVAQAVLFALSVLPVLSIARERLGSRQGYVVGAAYGTSFGVVQAVDFDFHELAFAAPLIALALLALLRERTRLLVFACVGLLCTKEEFGVTVVLPLGLAWALRDRTRWRRRLPLAALGLAASLLQVLVLIPALNPDHIYGFLTSSDAPGSAGDVEGLSQLFSGIGAKAHLLFLLGLATAFTALFSPLALLAAPDLLMRFASSNSSYWGTFYHYNAVLMPILFVAAVDGIARARAGDGRLTRLVGRCGVAGIGLAALWMLPDYALGQAFTPLPSAPGPVHLAALHKAVAEVPGGASVEASLGVLAPLAAKADAYWIGNTAIDPAPAYMVFDAPASGVEETPGQMVALADAWHPLASYTVVSSDDGVYVLRLL